MIIFNLIIRAIIIVVLFINFCEAWEIRNLGFAVLFVLLAIVSELLLGGYAISF